MNRPLRVSQLQDRFDIFRRLRPSMSLRQLARMMEVSEAELTALWVGQGVYRIRPEWGVILPFLARLGEVMVETRNGAVGQRHLGAFGALHSFGDQGISFSADLNLRLYRKYWAIAYVIEHPIGSHHAPAMVFFDAHGDALLKVFKTRSTDDEAWDAFVERFSAPFQDRELWVIGPRPKAQPMQGSPLDVTALLTEWSRLEATPEFPRLLRKYDVSRRHALRLAEGQFAWQVPVSHLQEVCGELLSQGIPSSSFVGNSGCVHVATGKVRRVVEKDNVLRVEREDGSLRCELSRLANAHIVAKPSLQGVIHSLELFDTEDRLVLQLFGRVSVGQVEPRQWREVLFSGR